MGKRIFSPGEIEKIKDFAPGKNRNELLEFIHQKLNRPEITEYRLENFLRNRQHMRKNMVPIPRKTLLTEEQTEWVITHACNRKAREIQEELNQVFGIDITYPQFRHWLNHRPHIKEKTAVGDGIHKFDIRAAKEALSYVLGTVREDAKGLEIKMTSGLGGNDNWICYSRLIWENAHGYTDKEIVHLDGDKYNFSLENLFPISRRAKAYMMFKNLWIYDDPELMKARILKSEVEALSNRLWKEMEN